MAFWNEVIDKVSAGTRAVADKAMELSDIANLKTQVASCDNTISKAYKDLGKAFYEAHKDDDTSELSEIMCVIKEAVAKKEELERKVREAKGDIKCKECGAIISNDVAYCPKCGAKCEIFEEASECCDETKVNASASEACCDSEKNAEECCNVNDTVEAPIEE